MKQPIIFLITSGFVFTKMYKPTKTAIEPEIETGNTSDQLTFFMALGRIAKAPNIYIGVIMPIAAIGPNILPVLELKLYHHQNPYNLELDRL